MTEAVSSRSVPTPSTIARRAAQAQVRSAPTLDVSATPPIPFYRLVKVEWRKMFDTRGGVWLAAITGALILVTMVGVLLTVRLVEDFRFGLDGLAQIFAVPLGLLMPVFAILAITSEWGQRTALTTFTLEPRRLRVLLAKWVAVSALAVATIVVAAAIGALTNLLSGPISGAPVSWEVDVKTLLLTVAGQLLYFYMAFAFAMLLLNTPGAIAIFYAVGLMLPNMVWNSLYMLFDWARNVLPWVEYSVGSAPVLRGVTVMGEPVTLGTTHYLQFGVTALLWIGVPLIIGLIRVLRTEVK